MYIEIFIYPRLFIHSFMETNCIPTTSVSFMSSRIWTAKTNVQPFSIGLVNELRTRNPNNIKLLRSIDEMLISMEEMKQQIAGKMAKRNGPSFEKRCLRSTNLSIQNRDAVQVPVVAPVETPLIIPTRNKKTKKEVIEIETEFSTGSKCDGKKHYLRSTRTVPVLTSEQLRKEAVKRHHKVSFQASIDPEEKNPPQKRARKTKMIESSTKERVNTPIARRTRSQIAKQSYGK